MMEHANNEIFIERIRSNTGIENEKSIIKYMLEYVSEVMEVDKVNGMYEYMKEREAHQKDNGVKDVISREERHAVKSLKVKMNSLCECVERMKSDAKEIYNSCLKDEGYLMKNFCDAISEVDVVENNKEIKKNISVIDNEYGCMYFEKNVNEDKETLYECRRCYGKMLVSYKSAFDAMKVIKDIYSALHEICEDRMYDKDKE